MNQVVVIVLLKKTSEVIILKSENRLTCRSQVQPRDVNPPTELGHTWQRVIAVITPNDVVKTE